MTLRIIRISVSSSNMMMPNAELHSIQGNAVVLRQASEPDWRTPRYGRARLGSQLVAMHGVLFDACIFVS